MSVVVEEDQMKVFERFSYMLVEEVIEELGIFVRGKDALHSSATWCMDLEGFWWEDKVKDMAQERVETITGMINGELEGIRSAIEVGIDNVALDARFNSSISKMDYDIMVFLRWLHNWISKNFDEPPLNSFVTWDSLTSLVKFCLNMQEFERYIMRTLVLAMDCVRLIVSNTKTKILHLSTCTHIKKINPVNRLDIHGWYLPYYRREEYYFRSLGYKGCSSCYREKYKFWFVDCYTGALDQ